MNVVVKNAVKNVTKNAATIAIIAFITLSIAACGPKKGGATNDASRNAGTDPSIVNCEGKENFVEFYEKFMTDSAFQMSRIVFPLEGKPQFTGDTTSFKEEYYYSSDTWIPHHKIDYKNLPRWKAEWYDYGFCVKEISDNAVDNMFLERRYRCDDGKWFLIYYSDLNKRNRSEAETPQEK
jgi:hypothetical protein